MTTQDEGRAVACGIVLDRLRSDDYGCDVNAGTHSRICDDIARAIDAARAERHSHVNCAACSKMSKQFYDEGVRDERERLLQRLHDDPDNVADWNDCCRRAASAMEADLRAAAPEAKES